MDRKKKKAIIAKSILENSKTEEKVYEISPSDKVINVAINMDEIFTNEHRDFLIYQIKKNDINYIIYDIITHNTLVDKDTVSVSTGDIFIESRLVVEVNKETTIDETIKKIYKELINFRDKIVILH